MKELVELALEMRTSLTIKECIEILNDKSNLDLRAKIYQMELRSKSYERFKDTCSEVRDNDRRSNKVVDNI